MIKDYFHFGIAPDCSPGLDMIELRQENAGFVRHTPDRSGVCRQDKVKKVN